MSDGIRFELSGVGVWGYFEAGFTIAEMRSVEHDWDIDWGDLERSVESCCIHFEAEFGDGIDIRVYEVCLRRLEVNRRHSQLRWTRFDPLSECATRFSPGENFYFASNRSRFASTRYRESYQSVSAKGDPK